MHKGDIHAPVIETMTDTSEGFTPCQMELAKIVQIVQIRIGCLSDSDFLSMVCFNMIKHAIYRLDIRTTTNIFGPNLASVRGKTTRQHPLPIIKDYVVVPRALWELNRCLTISLDVMFIGGMGYL